MKKLLSILPLLAPVFLFAQTTERNVIGSSGNFVSTATLQVSSTVGEAVTFSGTSATVILTQGFQQAGGSPVGITDVALALTMNAYPNPATNAVTLDIVSKKTQNLRIGLTDLNGVIILPYEKFTMNGKLQHTISLKELAIGEYFISITNEDGTSKGTMKVLKVQ